MTLENQDFTMWSGDDKNIVFAVEDADGASVDVSGACAVWLLLNSREATGGSVVRKTTSASGVTMSGCTATVVLAASDTASISGGKYYHELQLKTSGSAVATVAVGKVDLRDDAVTDT